MCPLSAEAMRPCSPIGVIVADSNPTQRELLVRALRRRSDFRPRACDLDAPQILEANLQDPAPVMLLSVDYPRNSIHDLAVLRSLQVTHPEACKLLLVDTYDRDLVVNAFRSGARGIFCFAEHPFRMLCKCIQAVHRGEVWANNTQLEFLLDAMTQVPSLRTVDSRGQKLLTPREEQVVALVADGLSNRAVGEELRLTEHTVKKYLFRIFEKLGISTRVELVLYALNHGTPRTAEWIAYTGGASA